MSCSHWRNGTWILTLSRGWLFWCNNHIVVIVGLFNIKGGWGDGPSDGGCRGQGQNFACHSCRLLHFVQNCHGDLKWYPLCYPFCWSPAVWSIAVESGTDVVDRCWNSGFRCDKALWSRIRPSWNRLQRVSSCYCCSYHSCRSNRWGDSSQISPGIFEFVFETKEKKRKVSLMIHSARPTVPPVAITIFTYKMFCSASFWKVGTDGRRYVRTMSENSDHYQ